MNRLALVGTQFPEYTLRLATSLRTHSEVKVFLDERGLAGEPLLGALARELSARPFSQARLWNRWFSAIDIIFRLLAFRPHLVVFHEHAHPHITFVQIVARLFSKTLLIVHDPAPHRGRDAGHAEKYKRSIACQRSRASAYIVHGDFCRRELQKRVPPGKPLLSVMHGAIMVPPSPPVSPEAGLRVLMLGRMEEYKGLSVLVEAVGLLVARHVRISVRVAGRGPEIIKYKEKLTNLGVEVIDKYLSVEEMYSHLKWCSVVALPYLEASQSGVVSAAFANGRGAVAANVGGLADSISPGVNGLLFEANSPAALADALEHLYRHPDQYEGFHRGALAAVGSSMNWDVIARQIAEFAGTL